MKFHVVGADKETGNDVEIDVMAVDRVEAEGLAKKRGVLVSAVEPIKDADPEQIPLAELEIAAPSSGSVIAAKLDSSGTVAGAAVPDVRGASAAGANTAGANVAGASVAGAKASGGSMAGGPGASAAGMPSPGASQAPASGESHATISGAVGASTAQAGAHMEYHIIMNQSLYLLEVAVNKHIKAGWEPQGSLCVGISNNAMQYFQAMIRHID